MKIGIVGAGPGGLAAGMLLASRGIDVTLFERNQQVGGRCGMITDEQSRYVFDMGPTFFMMPFILEGIFQECKLNLHNYVDLRLLEPYYQLVYRDGTRFYPGNNYNRVKRNIKELTPKDVEGFASYMNDNEKKFSKTFPALRRDYRRLTDMINLDTLRFLPIMHPLTTLWQELSKHFSHDQIKIGFTFQHRYLGMSPFRCPAFYSMLSYAEYSMGIFHVMGGLNQLSKGMSQAIQELGGKLELSRDVKEIKIDRGKVKGLEFTDGEQMEFDEVVMNADFAWGMRNLVPNEKRAKYTDKKLSKKRYSCSTVVLYLGLDKLYEQLMHHNIYMAWDYAQNFKNIENGELSEDPSFYLQNPCVTDPNLAPRGHSALYVLVPVPNLMEKTNWDEVGEQFRNKIMDLMKKRAGLTDIEKHIKFEKIMTPKDWERSCRVGFGAAFNLDHNLGQMMAFRPHNKFEEFDNMWLVGGGTNPGNGLSNIYESGRITAHGILKRNGYKIPEITKEAVYLGPS